MTRLSGIPTADARVQAVARFLRERRGETGLTRKEVASRAELTENTIVRLEQGVTHLRMLPVVWRLAKPLEISPYSLTLRVVDGIGDPEPRAPFGSFADELFGFGVGGQEAPKCLAQMAFTLRMRVHKTYETAAADSNMHPMTWLRIEKRETYPSIPLLAGMAHALAWHLPFQRRQLLIVAMRDELQRESCRQRRESWAPGWQLPQNGRRQGAGFRATERAGITAPSHETASGYFSC